MKYREKALRAKGERCADCGAEENIEVHHIDGNRWNNDLENLKPVCESCHARLHSGGGNNGEMTRITLSLTPEHAELLHRIADEWDAKSRSEAVRDLLDEYADAMDEEYRLNDEEDLEARVSRLEDKLERL